MNDAIDIKTRKPVQIEQPQSETISQLLNRWKKKLKDEGLTSILIIGMDEDGNFQNDMIMSDDFKLSLFAHIMDDVKKEMLDRLFDNGESDEEEQ